MAKTIYTGLGAVEYVTVTIPADVDISSSTVQVAVGSFDAPGSWAAPDSLTFSVDGLTATAKLLIGNGHTNPIAGSYYLWYRVVDTAEIVIAPVRGARFSTTDIAGIPVELVSAFGVISIVDNGDQSVTLTAAGSVSITDNGDGSATLAA